jgi:hypothetical protein
MPEIETKWLIIRLLHLCYFSFYFHFNFDCVLRSLSAKVVTYLYR